MISDDAMKISDILPYTIGEGGLEEQLLESFYGGFDSLDATYLDEELKYYVDWFANFVYRKYRDSFILSYYDVEMVWNKMYLFYENHIKEFLQVEEMWKANKDNLMNGLTSSSTVTNKVSGTPQDGESYIDSYPDTESKQVSEMNQSDKSVFKKLQELTKQLTNYKKTWADMFRKEMGLWIAL